MARRNENLGSILPLILCTFFVQATVFVHQRMTLARIVRLAVKLL